MSDSNQLDMGTIGIRVSDRLRRKAHNQFKGKYTIRKHTPLEIFSFNFIPIIATSTLLAPLYRIKIILQVQDLLPGDKVFKSKLTPLNVFKGIYSLLNM
jgi:hypothetical protein